MSRETFEFRPATKKKLKARLALVGPSGSGKTMSALRIGRGLVGPSGRIALIDTEYESASLYEDVTPFDTLPLGPPYSPERYIGAIQAAARAGYDLVVIDSLSHAWSAEGGILDQKDKMESRDKFGAWRTLTPQHNALVDALLSYPGHLIVTMRAKQTYEVTEDDRGKKKIEKLGLAPVQRDGLDYEMTVVGDIDMAHTLHITKTRCEALADKHYRRPGEDVAAVLLSWLDRGVDASPAAKPVPQGGIDRQQDRTSLRAWIEHYAAKLSSTADDRAKWTGKIRTQAERIGVDVFEALSWGGLVTMPADDTPDNGESAGDEARMRLGSPESEREAMGREPGDA